MNNKSMLSCAAVLVATSFFSSYAAKASNLAYVTTANQAFGVLDLDTGVFTQSGVSGAYLNGLGVVNGTLYGASTSTLYSVNTANGSLTAIGPISVPIWEFGSAASGLYGLGANYANLYSIDPATGAATLLGPTGVVMANTLGLSTGAAGLYLMVSSLTTSSLYSLNTTNGSGTLVGTSTPGVCLKNMAEVNGTLYSASGYCFVGSKTYVVNPANGASTFVANVVGFDDVLGLAPTSVSGGAAVPEASSTVLFLLGAALVLRRRQSATSDAN